MTDTERRNLFGIMHRYAKLVVIGMILQMLVIGYVFVTEHNGRQDAVYAAREGCERDKLDRTASVILNENILSAFREGAKANPKVLTKIRKKAIAEIASTTEGLADRAAINCHDRYPDARWLP